MEVLYELAVTLVSLDDCEGAIATAKRGGTYWSPLRGALYMMVGNCLDKLGRPSEALEFLEEAGKLQPDDYMVQYNLALTLFNAQRPASAVECLKRGINANAGHPSSHLLLGAIWQEQGLRIPALMAYCRFLTLEPASPRARLAAAQVQNLVEGTARVELSPNNRSIVVQMEDPRKEEGDFSQVLGALSLLQGLFGATQDMVKDGKADEGERLATILVSMCRALGDEKISFQETFACATYARYFAQASDKGHAEALSNTILQSAGLKGPGEWLAKGENKAKANAFREWSETYAPKTPTPAR